jgi:hypothetical protein
MLSAMILVCVLGLPCNEHTARAVLKMPDAYANPIACVMDGQSYIAQTSLGPELEAGEYVKVVCHHAD